MFFAWERENDSYMLTFKQQSSSVARMCCFMKRTDIQSNRQTLAQHSRSIAHNLYQMKSRRPLCSNPPKIHPQPHGTSDSWRKKVFSVGDGKQTSVWGSRTDSVSSDNVHFLSQSNHNPFKELIHFRWRPPRLAMRLPLEFSKTLPHPFSEPTYISIPNCPLMAGKNTLLWQLVPQLRAIFRWIKPQHRVKQL